MEQDPEIKVMNDAYQALNSLDDDEARLRVIQWIIRRFSLSNVMGSILGHELGGEGETPPDDFEITSFDTVADIFARANPTKDKDKALIVAAFLQEKYEKEDLTGSEINKELKHLGHGLKNVTDAINQLIAKKPKLMIQTRKEGSTQQARKKYKVTMEGIKEAKALLKGTKE